jgi:hypothetical protein
LVKRQAAPHSPVAISVCAIYDCGVGISFFPMSDSAIPDSVRRIFLVNFAAFMADDAITAFSDSSFIAS